MKILPHIFNTDNLKTQGFLFLPEGECQKTLAIFTHGYTSHKGQLVNWAQRLTSEGIPCAIFDLPGHLIGNFEPLKGLTEFKQETPQLFAEVAKELELKIGFAVSQYLIGGHSLGALMSLLAINLPFFADKDVLAICVGLGMPPKDRVHVFDSDFYKKTMEVRGQLVDPKLAPDEILPWIKNMKETLKVSGKKIYLLSGEDDVVVGKDGAERLQTYLQENNNEVYLEKPKSLGHHLPERAAAHIYAFLKKNFSL